MKSLRPRRIKVQSAVQFIMIKPITIFVVLEIEQSTSIFLENAFDQIKCRNIYNWIANLTNEKQDKLEEISVNF